MLSLPLTIRYREQPQHEPVAWLLPGNDAALWLEEWLRWELPQDEWRIAILPGWGVLTLLPAKQKPAVPPRGIPLGKVSARVYVPIHAEIVPTVTAEELESLLSSDFAAAALHPARGLLVIEPQELRSLHQLFEPPPFCARDWSIAEPGVALNERLFSVQPAAKLSFEQVFAEGRGDIGSAGGQFDQLPPRPQEPAEGAFQNAGRKLRSAAAQFIVRLSDLLAGNPQPANAPSPAAAGQSATGAARGSSAAAGSAGSCWLQSLTNWAKSQLRGVTREIEDLRNKELLRLMHLLQNNPDEGLKFALPFGSGGQHRGLAPPGGHLGLRDVNFNLNRLGGGGGPADLWDLPEQYKQQLARRYRELANRELQLGRHRRAAYIFGELLADLDAAASALVQGQNYREAAVIYRDKLNRLLPAADCLERGGLLHEAIELYDQCQSHEKVGDLYQRLEQFEDAQQAWLRAAAAFERGRDYYHSAKLFEEKLKDPESAAQKLEQSWQEEYCRRANLVRLFELFARHGWHERTRARLKALREQVLTDQEAVAASEALGDTVRVYPDRELAAFAADVARVIVATHLPGSAAELRGKLIGALQSLVPNDQLLQRDGQRYLREQAAKPPKVDRKLPATPLLRQLARGPQLVREFQLPAGVQWETFAAAGTHFYAVGNSSGRVDLRLCDWFGRYFTSPLQRRLPPGLIEPPQVAVDPHGQGPLLIATGLGKREVETRVPNADGFRRALVFESVDGFESAPYARVSVCYAFNRAFFIEYDAASDNLIAKGRIVNAATHQLGELATTFPLGRPREDNVRLPTHGRQDLLAVGHVNQLLLVRGERDIRRYEFDGHIEQIVGSAPFTRTRIAVVTTEAVYVIWIQGSEVSEPMRCASVGPIPTACFTIGGRLVIASGNGGEVYETTGQITLHSRFPWTGPPVAVLPTDEPDQFAIFTDKGLVRIYKIQ